MDEDNKPSIIKKKNINKNKNTRKPFRTISLNNDYNHIIKIDLCSYFKNENEYILFNSHKELFDYKAIFSFILYYYENL